MCRKHNNLIASFAGHSAWVSTVAFGADKTRFATGSCDRKVKVWDTTARQCLHTFDDHTDQVWGIAFNKAADRLVSVSEDRSFHVYSL